MVQNNRVLPFAMLFKSNDAMAAERGFTYLPETWNYNPKKQVSDLLKMGKKDTWSRVTSTTSGILSRGDDADEEKDD